MGCLILRLFKCGSVVLVWYGELRLVPVRSGGLPSGGLRYGMDMRYGLFRWGLVASVWVLCGRAWVYGLVTHGEFC
jgi:hypothetical protein